MGAYLTRHSFPRRWVALVLNTSSDVVSVRGLAHAGFPVGSLAFFCSVPLTPALRSLLRLRITWSHA